MKRKLDFMALSWTEAAPGARFKAFEQDARRVRLVEFSRAFVEHEWCRKAHIDYVISSELEVNFDGRPVRYAAGAGIFISGGEAGRHKARAVGETVRLFLVEDAEAG
jgi:hypothetical protein